MLVDLFTITYSVPELRYAVMALRRGIFRRGYRIDKKFKAKCTKCDTEFSTDVRKCTVCGSSTREPDPRQLKVATDFFKQVNGWDQTLLDVLVEVEDDVNIVDDAFILMPRQYVELGDGQLFGKLQQIVRHDPSSIQYDLDATGVPGRRIGACPMHRQEVKQFDRDEQGNLKDNNNNRCSVCGRKLEPIRYVARFRHGTMYLFGEEVIHFSKYSPSKLYGYSPVLTVMENALSVAGADRNMYSVFYQRKLPRGMIISVTSDVQGFKAERAQMQEKMRQDPEYVPWMVLRDTQHGKPDTRWVPLGSDPTGSNMYQQLSGSLRSRLPMIWGVLSPGAGGTATGNLNDFQVMLWAIEDGQRPYNEKVFPRIMAALGCDDWKVELLLPEERLEEAQLMRYERRTNIAQKMYAMGFDIALDEDTNEIRWSGKSRPKDDAVDAGPEEVEPEPALTGAGQLDRDVNGMARTRRNSRAKPLLPKKPDLLDEF
jgi:hypothetical protein